VKQRAYVKTVSAIALLISGSAVPLVGSTHWEGVEAADPATPAALLVFESAVGDYTALSMEARTWPADRDSDSGSHAEHRGAAPETPATMQ
jgi:hypothetical protein